MPELERRRKAVVVLLTILAVVLAAAIVSDLLEVSLLGRAANGEELSASEANSNDLRQGIIGLVSFGLWIATAVLFIRWMHYAYSNLDPRLRRFKTWWAIGGWFIPIMWLFRPKQIINDLADAGGPPVATGLLGGWWTAWLISVWVGNLYLRRAFSGDDAQQLHDAATLGAVCDAASLIAAVLAIFTVRAITSRVEAGGGVIPASHWTSPERPPGLTA
jgi:hypothetical protein